MQRQYNLRNPAVKRLMREAQELSEPTEQYHAQPLEDNLFEWHFTIRGPGDSEFDGGLYHGRIILPPEYPMKPPSIILLTPNGRFEINKKICLSISGYHPESWQPSWSIRTALLAIIGFMPTHGGGAIGSLDYTAQERKVLAKRSQGWKCPSCGDINNVLPEVTEASAETNREAQELASQISFQAEKEKKSESTPESSSISSPSVTAGSSENLPSSSTVSSTSPVQDSPSSQLPTFTNAFRFPPPPPYNQLPHQWQGDPNARFGPTFPLPFVGPMFPPMMPPPNAYRMPFPHGGNPFMRPPFLFGYPPAGVGGDQVTSSQTVPSASHTSAQSQSVSTRAGPVSNSADSANGSTGINSTSGQPSLKNPSTNTTSSWSAPRSSTTSGQPFPGPSVPNTTPGTPKTSATAATLNNQTPSVPSQEPSTTPRTEHSSSSSNPSTTTSSEIRHRRPTVPPTSRPPTVPPTSSSHTTSQQRPSNERSSLILLVIVAVAFGLLLLRRIGMMAEY